MSGFGGILELVGGALLVLGLFTRPVAFLLSGEMAIAYWSSHAPRGFFPVLNGGDAAILYCFIFLYLAFDGGGAWSLDRVLRHNGQVVTTRLKELPLETIARLTGGTYIAARTNAVPLGELFKEYIDPAGKH